ncbi:Aste57867_377 [Aphanomyces stellatus]|uniref:Aste57867_377 protein n=1 Tax=Aphanomyces stellatus TaxID=120398 RepID=A0A485K7F4_9STRA|nr:hypothetical protein As57867_000376 [Aphanomyces stellatus]VFT77602.1 Aste57867_377 [Aphanomyces stellatus]
MGNIWSFVVHQITAIADLLSFAKNPRQALLTCRGKYGDVFLVDSALVGTKIAGLCGPEALEQFQALLQDGTFVKKGGFPDSLTEVLGPILTRLDGQMHDDRKAKLMEAFSATQLDQYKPVVRRIVQVEHLRWVKLKSFSIVRETKRLLFKVLLTILYGLDDDDSHMEFIQVLDDYVTAVQQSLKAVDPRGPASRAKFIDQLIAPAIQRAKRVDHTNSSVLGFLVQAGKMTDEELTQECFHVMFASFGGLSTLAANMVTALAVFPPIRANMSAARATMMQDVATQEMRWMQLGQLGYLNQFVLEVKRFYNAGPTQIYTRATRNVQVKTSIASIQVPKGALVMAGLEATSKHPNVWVDAETFNPDRFQGFNLEQNLFKFCPHSLGSTNHRRCAGEELSTVILDSILLSLMDFTWGMVPGQDYTLESNTITAVPLGQLMVQNFKACKSEAGRWPFDFEARTS